MATNFDSAGFTQGQLGGQLDEAASGVAAFSSGSSAATFRQGQLGGQVNSTTTGNLAKLAARGRGGELDAHAISKLETQAGGAGMSGATLPSWYALPVGQLHVGFTCASAGGVSGTRAGIFNVHQSVRARVNSADDSDGTGCTAPAGGGFGFSCGRTGAGEYVLNVNNSSSAAARYCITYCGTDSSDRSAPYFDEPAGSLPLLTTKQITVKTFSTNSGPGGGGRDVRWNFSMTVWYREGATLSVAEDGTSSRLEGLVDTDYTPEPLLGDTRDLARSPVPTWWAPGIGEAWFFLSLDGTNGGLVDPPVPAENSYRRIWGVYDRVNVHVRSSNDPTEQCVSASNGFGVSVKRLCDSKGNYRLLIRNSTGSEQTGLRVVHADVENAGVAVVDGITGVTFNKSDYSRTSINIQALNYFRRPTNDLCRVCFVIYFRPGADETHRYFTGTNSTFPALRISEEAS